MRSVFFIFCKGERRCRQVVQLARCVYALTICLSGYADDHWYTGAGIVHECPLDCQTAISQHIAVIPGKDNEGIVVERF